MYVLMADFTYLSSRNSTAVCIYSIAKIEDIFETSGFKGYSGAIPSPRPGTVRFCFIRISTVVVQLCPDSDKDFPPRGFITYSINPLSLLQPNVSWTWKCVMDMDMCHMEMRFKITKGEL